MALPTPPNGKYFTGNFYLDDDQRRVNALFLYGALTKQGWTINAVAALCGNAHVESTINPGIWQNLAVNKGPGYGLTQWTPFKKYTNWCTERGLEKSAMESAVARLMYEVANPNVQWVQHTGYRMSFAEFIKSTDSPRYLAGVFFRNYEMAENDTQELRETKAQVYYNFLSGYEPSDPDPDPIPPILNQFKTKPILIPILRSMRNH